MVELRTRKREMRWDGTNHHEKQVLKRISCASLLTIPDTVVKSPNPASTHIDTRFPQPNPASHTPDFLYLLVSSTLFPAASPISLTLVHNSTIIAEHIVESSLSICPCHDHELTLSTSIHRVQHTPSTVSTQDCLSSLHSHEYRLTPEWNFRGASLHDRLPSAKSPWKPKGIVTWLHSHGGELTNRWIESQHPARLQSTASKSSSNLPWSRPPSFVQTCLITVSKCISKLAQSRTPSVSADLLNYCLQDRTIMASNCISKLAWLQPASANLQTGSNTASKLAQKWPPSSLHHDHEVHHQSRSVTISECISKFTRLSF